MQLKKSNIITVERRDGVKYTYYIYQLQDDVDLYVIKLFIENITIGYYNQTTRQIIYAKRFIRYRPAFVSIISRALHEDATYKIFEGGSINVSEGKIKERT